MILAAILLLLSSCQKDLQEQLQNVNQTTSTGSKGLAPRGASIVTKVEAESYSTMYGIKTGNSSEGTLNVGWVDVGDRMDYTVNVITAGTSTIELRVAGYGGQLKLKNSSGAVLTTVNVPSTGGWQTWTTVRATAILPEGQQTIRVYASQAGWNLNWWSFTTPTSDTTTNRIEAEDYSTMYGINTENSSSEGSLNVNYVNVGDWLDYTVNVSTAGTSTIKLRVAGYGGQIHLKNRSGTVLTTVNVPSTGGWQNWTTVGATATLPEGQQTIRIYASQAGWNLNWWSFTTTTTGIAPATGTGLLFKSGFESNVVMEGPTTGTSYSEKALTGIDAVTGFSWPITAWGGRSYLQTLAYKGYKTYLDPSNPRTGGKSLFQEVTTGNVADGGTYNQLPLIWSPSNTLAQQKDIYTSMWVFLQPDLGSKLVNETMPNGLWGNWRCLFEWKTGGQGDAHGGDLRTKVMIVKGSNGVLHWESGVDNNANGGYSCNGSCYAPVVNTSVPVPLGRWFRFETFTHRSKSSDGRFWAKVDGQYIINRYQMNIGVHDDPINRVFLSTVYSNGHAPQYQWIDDIEIWDTVPAGR
jgi:hypothetical protein